MRAAAELTEAPLAELATRGVPVPDGWCSAPGGRRRPRSPQVIDGVEAAGAERSLPVLAVTITARIRMTPSPAAATLRSR